MPGKAGTSAQANVLRLQGAEDPLGCGVFRAGKHRQVAKAELCIHLRWPGHLQEVAQQTKAGDIRGAAHTPSPGRRGRGSIELGHREHCRVQVMLVDVWLALCFAGQAKGAVFTRTSQFGRGGDNTRAQGFGQKESVPGPCPALAHHLFRMDQAGDAQPVEGFRGGDCVAAGNGRASLPHFGRAARENLGHRLHSDFFGETGNVQAEEHIPTHRVDVAHGIGRGNCAVEPGVIHNRREEVGGFDQGALVVQLVDGRIVRFAQTDQNIRIFVCREYPG